MAGEDYLGTSDLNAFNQSVLQSDPFGIAGRSLNSWQPNYATLSPTAAGLTAFTKSFLGGLLNGYATQNAADQTNAVIGILPQLESDPLGVTAPEGVNANAFSVLKGSAALKNFVQQSQDADLEAQTQKAIRQGLATTLGLDYDPVTKTAKPILGADGNPIVQNTLVDIAAGKAKAQADAKTKDATQNRATLGVAQDLSKLVTGMAALNKADKEVGQFYGARTFGENSALGGIVDYIGKFVPNTNAYQYNKDLPDLIDPVTQGIAGATRQGTLVQNKPMLTQDFGQTADSLQATQEKTKAELASKAASMIAILKAAGWPEDKPAAGPDGQVLPSLNDYLKAYDSISNGAELPSNAATQSVNLPPLDQNVYNNLRAQGKSPDEIRALYAGK